eukprot:769704-Prymnesium_polylepis.1
MERHLRTARRTLPHLKTAARQGGKEAATAAIRRRRDGAGAEGARVGRGAGRVACDSRAAEVE